MVAFLRKATRSLRSCFFLRPAKTILVPGIIFFGLIRYFIRVFLPQVMPVRNAQHCRMVSEKPARAQLAAALLTRLLVCRRVRVVRGRARSAAKEPGEVGTLLVALALRGRGLRQPRVLCKMRQKKRSQSGGSQQTLLYAWHCEHFVLKILRPFFTSAMVLVASAELW